MRVLVRLLMSVMVVCLGLVCCRPTPRPTFTCLRPSQQTVFRVRFHGFEPCSRRVMSEAFGAFGRVGVRFVETNEATGDIVVNNWSSPTSERIGEFQPSTRLVYVDSNRAVSDQQLQAIVLHELGHWLGMSHICVVRMEKPDCSPVGVGYAVMNPTLLPYHTTELTDLDIAEFRRSSVCR